MENNKQPILEFLEKLREMAIEKNEGAESPLVSPIITIPKEFDDGVDGPNRARLYLRMSNKDEEYLRSLMPDKLTNLAFDEFIDEGGYFDIIISQILMPNREKVQVAPMFGDNYAVFFYGKEPPSIQISGALFNAHNAEWWTEMALLYRTLLRGSVLSRLKRGVYLSFFNWRIYFSVVSFTERISADVQSMVPFEITGVVHKVYIDTSNIIYVPQVSSLKDLLTKEALAEDVITEDVGTYVITDHYYSKEDVATFVKANKEDVDDITKVAKAAKKDIETSSAKTEVIPSEEKQPQKQNPVYTMPPELIKGQVYGKY